MFVNALLNYLFHQDQPKTSTTPTTSTTLTTPSIATATLKGESLHSHITHESRADYTVYIIKRHDHPIAVLIEAKHKTNKAVKHALAQVTGYFAAFRILKTIPLVFVLTDDDIQVVIYPFKNGNGEVLINGVVLPPFPLFNDGGVPEMLTLGMVLTLAKYPDVETLITLPDGCLLMSRVALDGIVLTEQQAELAKERKLREEIERQLEEKEEEIQELRKNLKRTQENTVSIFGCIYMYNLCDVKVTGIYVFA